MSSSGTRRFYPVAALLLGASLWGVIWYPLRLLEDGGASIAGGGWGYFPGGCSLDMGWGWYGGGGYGNSVALTDGDLVVSQHTEPLDDDSPEYIFVARQ